MALSANKQGCNIHLSVCNTTTNPIEKQTLTRIFERFYRLDSSRSTQTDGYGIGLSVEKAIMTAHN